MASDNQKTGKKAGNDYAVGYGKPPKEHQFSKDNRPENTGRRPSMLKRYIKDNGVSLQDVRLVIKDVIMEHNIAELKKIGDDETEPMLVRVIIKSYIKDFEAGRIDTLNSMLDRIYGKANQDMYIKADVDETVTTADITDGLTHDQKKKMIEEWMKKNG